jgi:hypothetical protein
MKTSRLILSAAIAIFVAAGSFWVSQKTVFANQSVAVVTTTRYTSFKKTGAPGLTEDRTFARRSDGSTVNARHIKGPGSMGMITQRDIIDLFLAKEIAVDQTTESITSEPLTPQFVSAYLKPPNCGSAGPETLLGYGVVRDTKDYDNPGKFMRRESWRAPSLGCVPLKETVWIGPDAANLRVASTREALTVTLGEPPAELFAIPSNYVELSPSQRSAEFSRRFPAVKNPPLTEQDDELYRLRNKNAGR